MNPEQARLSICLLGSFRVTLDGELVTGFVSDKARALLAYLAVEADRPHRRERLAGLLWPDYPDTDARGSLRTALNNLRGVIGDREADPKYLDVTWQEIQFNRDSDSWVDVLAFGDRLAASQASPGTDPQVIVQLEEAVGWYQGDFLEGFAPADCQPFEEWALTEQEALRRRAWEALERLVAWYEERGEFQRALPYARRQVDLDPLQESAHRHVMRLLALGGERAAALRHYEVCCEVLQAEIGVEPDEKTARLHEQVRSGVLVPSATASRPTGPVYIPSPPPDPDELPEPGDLPPGSRLPFGRNALFTGRQRPLLALARALLHDGAGSTVVTQTIQGMGGIGKTQLAVEFAYRYGRGFHGVHWLNCAQPDLLAAEIAACGEKMLLPGWPDEQPQQVERTLRAWHDGHRLIILDNLEDLDLARDWFPSLAGADIRVLVTARRSDWPRDMGLNLLPLELFTPAESHAFLRRYLPSERVLGVHLDTLSERLGHLPLALRLAGRYLARHPRLSVDAYLDQLADLLDHPSMTGFRVELGDPVGHDLDLAATFLQSWQEVSDDDARRIFLLTGYCAPNQPIPCHLLERAADLDQDACDASLSLLAGLGLLQLDDVHSGPTIHPLVAEYSRKNVLLAEGVGGNLDVQAERDFSPLPALSAASLALAREANQLSSPARFAPIRPHIEAAAPAAQAAGLEEAGALWNELGKHLEVVAEYQGARRAIDRALAIDEAAFGPDHPHVARDLNNLAMLLRTLGDYEDAEVACRRALAIDEAALGPDHPDVARDYGNLGTVLWSKGDHQPAQAALQRALEIFDGAPESNQIMAAETHSHMGLLLADMGDYSGALNVLQRAVTIGEAVLAPDHPEMSTLINNKGLALWYLGDHAGARVAFQRALTITEVAFHPNHPRVAQQLGNLGAAALKLGDYQSARDILQRALAIEEMAFGPDHPGVATNCNTLGTISIALADYGTAWDALQRALAIWTETYGEDSRFVAIAHLQRGRVLHAWGSLTEAQDEFRLALATFERSVGPDYPETATAHRYLGLLDLDLGDYEAALSACQQALTIREAALGQNHPDVARDLHALGQVLLALDDSEGALAACQRALTICEDTYGREHPETARALSGLGIVAADTGEVSKARECLEEALAILERFLPAQHPDIRELIARLSSLSP